MPFCTRCGSGVGDQDSFCHQCGAKQAYSNPAGARGDFLPGQDFLAGISQRTASILCYIPVFGVIPAIVFLASQRFRNTPRVRFDGFQAVYLFVVWLIVSSAAPVLFFGGLPVFGIQHMMLSLAKLGVFGCWVYLLIKAAQEQQVRLPIVGDLAARSTAEQL